MTRENTDQPLPSFKPEFRNYSLANETPEAIIAGLDIHSTDSVLTVGVDQAFALLEKAHSVTFAEIEPYYANLVRARANLLAAGNDNGFLNLDTSREKHGVWYGRRYSYFAYPGRLDRIQANLGHLTIVSPADAVHLAQTRGDEFDKIYLSNALGYFGYSRDNSVITALSAMSQILRPDTLVYIVSRLTPPSWEDKRLLPNGLTVDDHLSVTAQQLEKTYYWHPRVYRQTAQPHI